MKVLDVVEFEATLFIVMEFLDGVLLPLSWNFRSPAEILRMFHAAGSALIAAHEVGLLHRDFKPNNMMVHHARRIVIMDFGLLHAELSLPALEHTPDAPLEKLACMHGVVGTPAYMAPEQWLSVELTARADQFSFCVVLWEALHGERPFDGSSVDDLAQSVLSGDIRSPQAGAVGDGVRDILARGLQVDPSYRFPSMAALLAALDAAA